MSVVNKRWTLQGERYPVIFSAAAGFSVGPRLFVIGGAQGAGAGTANNRIFTCEVLGDGRTTPWVKAGDFPVVTSFSTAVYHEPSQTVYHYGGSSPNNNKLYAAPVSGAVVGPWRAVTSWHSTINASPSLVLVGDYLYMIGGSLGRCDSIRVGSTGMPRQLPPILDTGVLAADARSAAAVFAYAGYMYVVGGFNTQLPLDRGDCFSAPIEPNGGLGAWKKIGSLPIAMGRCGGVVRNDRLLMLGGRVNGAVGTDRILSAPLLANGGIGVFTDEDRFPVAFRGAGNTTFVVGNRIIVVGGFTTTNVNTVYTSELK